MLIDCDTCQARGDACADCVVSVMLGMPGMPGVGCMPATVDVDEVRAIGVLADSGLVPPLRLVIAPPGRAATPKSASEEPGEQAM